MCACLFRNTRRRHRRWRDIVRAEFAGSFDVNGIEPLPTQPSEIRRKPHRIPFPKKKFKKKYRLPGFCENVFYGCSNRVEPRSLLCTRCAIELF